MGSCIIISIITKMFSWLCLLVLSILQVTMAVDINTNALEGLPSQQIFQPQPPPKIPVRDGERREIKLLLNINLEE